MGGCQRACGNTPPKLQNFAKVPPVNCLLPNIRINNLRLGRGKEVKKCRNEEGSKVSFMDKMLITVCGNTGGKKSQQ